MPLTRRQFVKAAVAAGAGAAAGLAGDVAARADQPASRPAPKDAGDAGDAEDTRVGDNALPLRWLEGRAPAFFPGATCGVPWPRGTAQATDAFTLTAADTGATLPLQTWPLATWPDGSLKWTAHALGPSETVPAELLLRRGEPGGAAQVPTPTLAVRETDETIEIDTGVITCRAPKRGGAIIESIDRDGRPILTAARLVCLRQDAPPAEPAATEQTFVRRETFRGATETAAVEQAGPIRAVVRLDGKHAGPGGREWLPFTVRLTFYAGGDTVRLVHTFVFDGDEHRDFLAGLGVRFGVPMRDALHDRHVRFAGGGGGLWGEAVRGLTGLRRDPGQAAREAQVAGRPTPPVSEFPESVRNRLELIPAWGDYTLSQLSADGFEIRKRTKPGHAWIRAAAGTRAAGSGYIGGITGGVAFGLRNFWQLYPTQLDIRDAASERAEVTTWLWSPDAPPMDLRFYHDGLGMDTHAEELQGLEITYEDYEKGFGTPHGVARTSELTLRALAATPSREETVAFADAVAAPPLLVCPSEHYVAARVFGGLFSVPDRSTPAKARIEDQLDYLVDLFQSQVEQHRWYGFWDYGDFMHSYDRDRHTWRYDVGGFAWANSELSPDLWLWYTFLRRGRADVFRLAEAMTRHTGEVDVHHLGRFKGLGSRHNVQHWGCSAKQARISTAANRRFYYFLTADERVGDLLREQLETDRTFLTLDPIRKIRREPFTPQPHALGVGFGTDWGSLAAAWLAEWERTGDAAARDKLLNGMRSIGAMPHGFFTRGATYDLATGTFAPPAEPGVGASHLSAVFGLAEVCAELVMLLDVPEFERAWDQYCRLYNAPDDAQAAELGAPLRRLNLGEAHSRLTAQAASRSGDAALAARAWQEFIGGGAGLGVRFDLKTTRIAGPHVLTPVDEGPGMSTNAASQWGLAAIQNLALIGHALPAQWPPPVR